jgi:hypothetical protein
MSSIYENAFVTLAATCAHDSNGGLFEVDQHFAPKQLGEHPGINVQPRRKTSQMPLTYGPFSTSDHSKHMRDLPLLFRAWVYQERRLSRRVIHFTRHQVLWECKSYFLSEDQTTNIAWDSFARKRPRAIHTQPFGYWSGDPIADWRKTVSEFQGLQLTYESDRLLAIAALAERMMRTRRGMDTYIAGMWRNSILHDLCWYHHGDAYERPKSTTPSWSWASIRGNVMWADIKRLPGIQVSDIQFISTGPANVGEVIDASIKLKGRVIEGFYEHKSFVDWRRSVPCGASMIISGWTLEHPFNAVTHFYPDFRFDLGTPAVTHGDPITTIIISKRQGVWTGLMLRRTTRKLDEYERIGLVFMQHEKYRSKLRSETKDKEDKQVEGYINSLPLKALKIV